MNLKRDIEKKIERKQAEIRDWEMRIREANAYVQALQETLKMLPRETTEPTRALRPGTSVDKAYRAIKMAGKPLQINEILKAIGRTADKKNRLSLSGSLAHYVREEEIFTRPAPNTFGLIELNEGDPLMPDEPDEDDERIATNGAAHGT